MASSGYRLPSYLTSNQVSDADVDQLLEQFQDESMLSLKLGSHRIGTADLEPLASEDFTPAYLQDDDGGLDKDLAARLSALKAPRKGTLRAETGPTAAGGGIPKTSTSDESKSHSRTCETPSLKAPAESGADTPEAAGKLSDLRPTQNEEKSQQSSGSMDSSGESAEKNVPDLTRNLDLDPHDVATLGVDLATRLHLLKAHPGGGQKEGQLRGQSKGALLEVRKVDTPQNKPDLLKPSSRSTASGQRIAPPASTKDSQSSGGAPFVDLSRGGTGEKSVNAGVGSRKSWSNPLAGLFGRPRVTGQPGAKSNTGAKESEGAEAVERRAQAVLAGVSKAGVDRRGPTGNNPGTGAAIDPNSELFHDIQGVAGASPEYAYEEVKKDEQKERLEAEALIAALHDDLRLRKGTAGLGLGEVDSSADSDTESESFETTSKSRVKEVASWAVDAARLEVLDGDAGSPNARSRRGDSSGDEGTATLSYGSGSDSDVPASKRRNSSRKRATK